MNCHECARTGADQVAVSICRFCSVALCKDHLVAAFHARTVPQYSCEHHPERPFVPVVSTVPAARPAQSHRAA